MPAGGMLSIGTGGQWTDSPSEDDVQNGVSFGSGLYEGNLVLPEELQVRDGIQYGANGTEYTGTFGSLVANPQSDESQQSPFTHVMIDRLISGGTQVTWALKGSFDAPTPWSFSLQWAQGGADSDEWTTVTTVSDSFSAVDSTERERTALLEGYYRVVLTDGDGNTHSSIPSAMPSTWTTSDIRYSDEARRRFLRQSRASGQKCWVLYRRHWGTKCSACVSDTSGVSRDPRCSTCYGTSIAGGYFNPYPTRLLVVERSGRLLMINGSSIQKFQKVLVAPIPIVHQEDVIIVEGTDARLEVKEASPEVVIKGRTVVESLALEAVEPGDILYDMTWGGSSEPTNGEMDLWTPSE